MKKIFYILLCLFIITALVASPVVCFAAEDSITDESVIETPENVAETPENVTKDEPTVTQPSDRVENETDADAVLEEPESDIFTRIYEFVTNNKTDIFSVTGSLALLVFGFITKKGSSTNAASVKAMLTSVKGENAEINKNQNAIVNGLNQLIEGYDNINNLCTSMFEKYKEMFNVFLKMRESNSELSEDLKKSYNELAEQLLASSSTLKNLLEKEMTQNSNIMQVLTSVYTNSKALPQGVKDLVQLKYSDNLKLVAEEKEIVSNSDDKTTSGGAS